MHFVTFYFFRQGVLALHPSQDGGAPIVGCPLLFIQYIRSYPTYLQAVSSSRNLRTRHAAVTGTDLSSQVKKNKMGGTRGTFGRSGDVLRVFMGKPERKRALGRLRRRWEDNIKMDVQEIELGLWTALIWLQIGASGGLL